MDTGDAKSTSNLQRHAKVCWGNGAIEAAGEVRDVYAARDAMAKATPRDSSLTAVFERISKKNQVTYDEQHRLQILTSRRWSMMSAEVLSQAE